MSHNLRMGKLFAAGNAVIEDTIHRTADAFPRNGCKWVPFWVPTRNGYARFEYFDISLILITLLPMTLLEAPRRLP